MTDPVAASRQPSARTETDEPLIVVFSFLSRADSTPLAERRRAPGHVLGGDGKAIADPATDPSANAFESDPNINFEKWGEYWRKVHGVRFTYAEDGQDRSLDRLRRYDQIHRLAAGPTNLAPLPYAPPVDADGKLFPTIIGHVEPYRRPRWDGVAYLVFETADDIGTVLASERVRTKILPEDQAIFRDIAPVLSRQFVILPSEIGRDAIALVRTHVRKNGLDRAGFQERWLRAHADLVLAQPDTQRLVTRYVQLHNIGPTTEGEPFFHPQTSLIDGVTLMSFASMNDVEEFLLTEGYRMIVESEEAIGSVAESEYWTAINFNIVDRIRAERPTKRR